jgi:hypothetical protein
MEKHEEKKGEKNNDSAVASFILGILCIIPWLNWVISLLAVYFGARAIRRIRSNPSVYGGMAFAIIGTVIGASVFLLNLTGVLFFGDSALFPLG